MIYLLFAGIILLGIISFLINKKHILNPSCIACSVFSISALFAIYSKDDWKYDLHLITIFVILSSLFIFCLGTYIGTYISDQHYKFDSSYPVIKVPSFSLTLIVTLFFMIFAYNHYKTIYKIAVCMEADIKNFGSILRKARDGMLYHGYSISRLNAYSIYFSRAAAYVFLYTFIYNKLVNKILGKKDWYLLLPCIPYLINMILSTGRTQLIYFCVFILVVYGIIFFQEKGISTKSSIEIMIFGIIVLLSFFGVFAIIQILREKSSKNLLDIISFYTGMSIPSLDDFLVKGRPESLLIGNNTLFPIYDILRKFGMNLPKLYAPYDFVSFNGTRGNVYTAFRRYIEDYTLWGNFIILLILGTISSFFYNYVYKKKRNALGLIVFAMFIYPVFEISIEERVLMNLIGTSTIYNLIAIFLTYEILLKTKIKLVLKNNFS